MEPLSLTSDEASTQSQRRRSPSPDGNGDEDPAQKRAPVRKRTKTGCLTCRKRRIKCDEGKPTCNNCLKSKRQCEGYNQRVIFKDPLGAFAGAPYGPIQYPAPSPQALVREQQISAAQQRSSSSQSLQIIAPKPPAIGYHQPVTHQFSHFHPGHAGPVPPQPPVNLTPNQFLSQPQPSKFTFFPPTTVDAFTQGQWRQAARRDNAQYPLRTAQDGKSKGPIVVSSHSHRQPEENGASVELEPKPQGTEGQFEDWEYEFYDDDVSMGESDDDFSSARQDLQLKFNLSGAITSQRFDHQYHMFGTHTRTFSTIGAETVLATYDPSPVNSPLTDKHVAAVFWHFINVTGPSMSLYERHPLDPSTILGQAPNSKQHGWTYGFPIMSFSHPALLQAILALGSLQIAKLQKVPPTASLKHYHLAIRRIAKNVSRPARRTQTANLAATLLLAFYEVWNSDHDKWCRHLLGARWIIKEIPLSDMTRAIMAIKMQKRHDEMERSQFQTFGDFHSAEDSGFLHKDWDLMDVPLLSIIMGFDVSYDDLGMLPEDLSTHPRPKYFYTDKDMERYEQLSDLFWWYCKMDVYQSILGGTRPFLQYHTWMQCPPRAPIGRLDAIYGSYDYLILLLGRLANFVSRDLSRKRETLSRSASSGGGPPSGMFAGMMPASDKVTLPMGFSPPREDSSPPPSTAPQYHTDSDLDTRTVEALREWEQILSAFQEVEKHFGPDFAPLGPDIYPTQSTPYGPAIHYRTYSVAGVWLNFYMGLIVLHRAHPKMPPVAMLAAGMSAITTMPWALKIGQIAAGLEENIAQLKAVSTLMGAALIESAFPLFVAGVQFQDEAQRHWLIRRLRDIGRLTGWQSAHQIADGCESAWLKAASLGRGPAYRQPPEPEDEANAKDVRSRNEVRKRHVTRPSDVSPPGMAWVWGNPRRLDRRILEEDGAAAAAAAAAGGGGGYGKGTDSKKIVLAKGEKAFYAMGLLTVEQDLEKLDLDSDER